MKATDVGNTACTTLTITNRLGLHARPAMLFVECANQFQSAVTVRRTDQAEPLDGKSIMHMMMLAATQGTEVEVAATGDDAPAAIAALTELIQSNFREE